MPLGQTLPLILGAAAPYSPPYAPPVTPVGELFAMISQALNDLGDTTAQPDPRIQPAVAMLSKINSEYLTNPAQAGIDAYSLAGRISVLLASNPTNSRLADALDAAQQLAGTWSGNDYV